MISLETYRDEAFIASCETMLKDYVQSVRGIDTALLASQDGFEIASNHGKHGVTEDKLAAVGSSLMALGSSLVQEFKLEHCKNMTIDSDGGMVFISAIRSENHQIILMVKTNKNAVMGSVIHGSSKVVEAVSESLDQLTIIDR